MVMVSQRINQFQWQL